MMLVILTGLCLAAVIINSLAISYILPYLKCDLELTIGEQGALNSYSFLIFSHHTSLCLDVGDRVGIIWT